MVLRARSLLSGFHVLVCIRAPSLCLVLFITLKDEFWYLQTQIGLERVRCNLRQHQQDEVICRSKAKTEQQRDCE
jgi:hypothetical protein